MAIFRVIPEPEKAGSEIGAIMEYTEVEKFIASLASRELSDLCTLSGAQDYLTQIWAVAMDPVCWLGEEIMTMYEVTLLTPGVINPDFVLPIEVKPNAIPVGKQQPLSNDPKIVVAGWNHRGYRMILEVMLADESIHELYSGYDDEREWRSVSSNSLVGRTLIEAQSSVDSDVRSTWYPGCRS